MLAVPVAAAVAYLIVCFVRSYRANVRADATRARQEVGNVTQRIRSIRDEFVGLTLAYQDVGGTRHAAAYFRAHGRLAAALLASIERLARFRATIPHYILLQVRAESLCGDAKIAATRASAGGRRLYAWRCPRMAAWDEARRARDAHDPQHAAAMAVEAAREAFGCMAEHYNKEAAL
jgi:hypothetical protein